MRARPVLSIALAAATLLGPGPIERVAGAASDDTIADAAIRRGVELRKLGKDPEALEEFRKAYAAAKTPRALAQIGLAEQALGRWVDAESDLESAMASKSDPWIRKNAATLNGALEVIRRHLGSLDVIGPEGADLRVDGRAAGTLPLARPARVPIGTLTVELRKSGFFPATRPITIAAGELTRESIDLPPVAAATPAAPPTTPRPPLPPPISGGAGNNPPETLPPDSPPHGGPSPKDAGDAGNGGGGLHRTLAWTAAVGALLGGAAGVGALLYRSSKVTNANDLACHVDDANGTVKPDNPENNDRCTDLASAASRAKLGAIISFSAAGALAVTAVVLFATAPSGASRTASQSGPGTRLACAPTLGTTGVTCAVRF